MDVYVFPTPASRLYPGLQQKGLCQMFSDLLIFISHTSADKPFVRRIDARLRKAGYATWLDEHKLLPGDPLAETISEALTTANVVLVVVSAASVKSKWLRFELNKATERMIHGQCRVIPVIKERVDLPAEVRGILYADFSESFTFGLKSILTALEHEVNRRNLKRGFWAQMDALIQKVFGATRFVSANSEFDSWDYNVISVADQDVIYDVISSHGLLTKPLADGWWSDYTDCVYRERDHEHLFLVVTERAVGFATDVHHPDTRRVTVRFLGQKSSPRSYVVLVDLSELDEEADRRDLLVKARDLLIRFARELRPARLTKHPD
jgi:hypothetical protein